MADIADKAGVTPSTVYRALNNKAGVSEEKREEIQEIAREMGYVRNVYASTLKRGKQRIAVILPEIKESRDFGKYLWQGTQNYAKSNDSLPIELVALPYRHAPEDLSHNLHSVLNGDIGKVDGVICFGSAFEEPNRAMAALQKMGIPVINLVSDSKVENRLSIVRPDAEMAGRMAADLLLQFNTQREYNKILVIGDFRGTNQHSNSVGFEKQVWENPNPAEILKITNPSHLPFTEVKQQIRETLHGLKGIGAVYCCNATGTRPMMEVVAEITDRHIYTIGSDLFPDSVMGLLHGKLDAVIHNRPVHLGYQAMEIMLEYLIQDRVPEKVIEFPSIVVMKSNLQYYAEENGIVLE